MRSLTFLLRLLLFTLAAQAKHDGLDDSGGSDDDDKGSSSPPPAPPASTQLQTSTSIVLSTSTLTATPNAAPSSVATASLTASSAMPSGALEFSPPANISTCEPAVFTWEFDPSTSVPIMIIVTNERAVSGQSSSPNQAPLVDRTISTSVDARVCVVSWPHADVPPGAYTLVATDTAHSGTVSAQSTSFFVNEGSDTSCLNQNSTTSATADPSSDSGAAGGGANDTAANPSSAATPKSMSVGAIVGTIAGILVGVGGLLLVFSLPRLRRHIFRSKAPPRPGGPYMTF